MEQFFSGVSAILRMPLVAIVKTVIWLLNWIPVPVYEVHGIQGFNRENRPDLRAFHTMIKGRQLRFGSWLIAYPRGAIFEAHLNSHGKTCWGVYTEDYEDIQKKWTW